MKSYKTKTNKKELMWFWLVAYNWRVSNNIFTILNYILQLYISNVQLFSSSYGRSSLSPRVSLPLLLSLDTVFCFLFSYFWHYSSLLTDSNFIERLQWIKLTIEEGEVIQVRPSQREKIIEECSLSLFGRFLTSRLINLRQLRIYFVIVGNLDLT